MPNELELRVIRMVAWRIVPFIMTLTLVSFVAQVNIGFAVSAMNKEIGLTPAMFVLGGGVFFPAYFLVEVPSNLLLHRLRAPLDRPRHDRLGRGEGGDAFHGGRGHAGRRKLCGFAGPCGYSAGHSMIAAGD